MITKRNWSRRVDLAFFFKRGVQLLKGRVSMFFFCFFFMGVTTKVYVGLQKMQFRHPNLDILVSPRHRFYCMWLNWWMPPEIFKILISQGA